MADFVGKSAQRLTIARDASAKAGKEMLDSYMSVRSQDIMTKVRRKKEHDAMEGWSPFRTMCGRIVRNPAFDLAMLLAVLLNLCAIIVEVNMEAKGQIWRTADAINVCFITLYSLEIAFRISVERSMFFTSTMNVTEFCLVALDVVLQILIVSLVGQLPKVSLLRVFRTLRFVRIIRTLSGFRELWLMLHGFVSAMRAIMWAILLIGIVLLLASVLSTQILHPIAQKLDEEGYFSATCTRCSVAFDSVQSSMLTWFILVFLGDQWDSLVTPILEHHPLTSALVFPLFFIIQFGMLNLILTVIVDRASVARQEDACQVLSDKQKDYAQAAQRLLTLCEAMDEDCSGCISLSELESGFDNIEEIAAMLKVMDIERQDLKTVFEILDHDRNGVVHYHEFVDQLHRMKTEESHTLLIFMKHFIVDISHKVTEQMNMLKRAMEKHHERQGEEMHTLIRATTLRSPRHCGKDPDLEGFGFGLEATTWSVLPDGVGVNGPAQDSSDEAQDSTKISASQWNRLEESSGKTDSAGSPRPAKVPGEATSCSVSRTCIPALLQTLKTCENGDPSATPATLHDHSGGKAARRVAVV
eukprot:TRINITY_DN3030_c0_g1_i1.p1 TRINITY_DN3030_c0_g1~~TRINITY_DN3030_c0_g1_i1.p1  ORF type:complete len:605 (-),score=59.82 TRINITY_DN3030_c0_g1_i1:344-2095(-)